MTEDEAPEAQVDVDSRRESWAMLIHLVDNLLEEQRRTNELLEDITDP
jgi:hypothetical protein